jgi:hypothetical protein
MQICAYFPRLYIRLSALNLWDITSNFCAASCSPFLTSKIFHIHYYVDLCCYVSQYKTPHAVYPLLRRPMLLCISIQNAACRISTITWTYVATYLHTKRRMPVYPLLRRPMLLCISIQNAACPYIHYYVDLYCYLFQYKTPHARISSIS